MKDSRKETERQAARSGFTLVELIVVIAILGILAGIAYPAYTGYIKRANDAAVVSQLSEVLAAVDSAKVIARSTDKVQKIEINMSDGTIKIYDTNVTDGNENKEIVKDAKFVGALVNLGSGLFKNEEGTVKVDLSKFDKLDDTSYNGAVATWSMTAQKWTAETATKSS